jgi:hypothetical protein
VVPVIIDEVGDVGRCTVECVKIISELDIVYLTVIVSGETSNFSLLPRILELHI